MYAEAVIKNPNSAILVVSYQVPGTPGEVLLNEHKYTFNNGEQQEIACEVLKYDFSSHSGLNYIFGINRNSQTKYAIIRKFYSFFYTIKSSNR